MFIQGTYIFGFSAAFGPTLASEKRFDYLVSQNMKCRDAAKPLRGEFVLSFIGFLLDNSLGAKLFEIVGGLSRGVGRSFVAGDFIHFGRKLGGRESFGRGSQSDKSSHNGANSEIVGVDAGHATPGQDAGHVQLIQEIVVNKSGIHATKNIEETVDHCVQRLNHIGKFVNDTTTTQILGVMSNTFDTKDAFAFAVDLGGEPFEVNFEHRQIPDRSLDLRLEARLLSCIFLLYERPMFKPKNGLERFYVKRGTSMVNDAVKDLFHMSASRKQEVAAIFELIHREGITKAAALLFLRGQGKTQTCRIDPTLADFDQAPYSAWSTHGICDVGQACSVGKLGKAIAFFDKVDAFFLGFDSHVFVSVEDDLRGERRMGAETNNHVPPVRVHDVEEIMLDVAIGLGDENMRLPILGVKNIAHGCWSHSRQNAKHAPKPGKFGDERLSGFVLSLPSLTINQGDVFLFRIRANPAAETAGETHEVCVVQLFIAAKNLTPPCPESAAAARHWKVGIEHEAIHAIIGVIKKIRVGFAKFIQEVHRASLSVNWANRIKGSVQYL